MLLKWYQVAAKQFRNLYYMYRRTADTIFTPVTRMQKLYDSSELRACTKVMSPGPKTFAKSSWWPESSFREYEAQMATPLARSARSVESAKSAKSARSARSVCGKCGEVWLNIMW